MAGSATVMTVVDSLKHGHQPTTLTFDSAYGSGSSDSESLLDFTPQIPLPPRSKRLDAVLETDQKTPDAHVARDPRLIRLTGVHPFNSEAPLSDLYGDGFLTSARLHYVRNHGAVPECADSESLDWEFEVCGEVEQPFRITLKALIAEFEQITLPISLICAGNRRKEQNVVRKSKGFSWGPAGVSTALWTGCLMSDLIRRARPTRKARYVCMEGADKLPNGFYGTSVKLNWVLDPNRGIMIAHRMNGETLEPDHGKPVRVIVPGQIGGRSVKWLKKIIVTRHPSDNWYHIYDNRVLPTMISPEESANNTQLWKDENYAIYDLSVNSATAFPSHNETISLDTYKENYNARGYAYSGGGKRVTRVELSLDQGMTWRLADIDYPEDRYRDFEGDLYNSKLDMAWRENSFCWCFWTLSVPVADLEASKDIVVRAMDESMQIQPRDMYWNVLGMMNNPWFRIIVHKEGNTLRFEHPTQPALMPGGWMDRVKKEGGNIINGRWGQSTGEVEPPAAVESLEVCMVNKDQVSREIDLDEFKQHSGEIEPWFVVNGHVYDGTAFLEGHPGGAASIFGAAGQDATDEFMAIHSETAKAMMPDYHIGHLPASATAALSHGDKTSDPAQLRPVFLQPKAWSPAKLLKRRTVTWDTRILTFALQHPDQSLGLPTGQHLMIRMKDPNTNDAIIRSYTPITEQSDRGTVDVLVKVYFDRPGIAGGKMSQALDKLVVGDAIDFKGPIGKFEYLGGGKCVVQSRQRSVSRFLMICGGSGVTPVYQVFRAIMRDTQDETRCVLLDGNRLEEDILCREELDELEELGHGKGRIVHTLTQASESWKGRRGRIAGELLREYCSRDDAVATMVLVCGPAAMEKSVRELLLSSGWAEQDLVFF